MVEKGKLRLIIVSNVSKVGQSALECTLCVFSSRCLWRNGRGRGLARPDDPRVLPASPHWEDFGSNGKHSMKENLDFPVTYRCGWYIFVMRQYALGNRKRCGKCFCVRRDKHHFPRGSRTRKSILNDKLCFWAKSASQRPKRDKCLVD